MPVQLPSQLASPQRALNDCTAWGVPTPLKRFALHRSRDENVAKEVRKKVEKIELG